MGTIGGSFSIQVRRERRYRDMGILKDKTEKEEGWKESIGKGEEPCKFFRNFFKLALIGNMLVMFLIFFWIFISYPEAAMPIMIFGMVSLIVCGSLTGLLEYWLVEKEGTFIKLGHLAAMPFLEGEYPMSCTVTFKTKDGKKVEETWVGGRLGKIVGWWGSWGGGKKGYWACKLLKKAHLDESHNPVTVVWEDADKPGYWEGSQYRIPMNFSQTYIEKLYDPVARMIRADTARYRWNSRVYVAERPLPEKFRQIESPSDMETKLDDRNEEIAMLRAKIRRMNIDESIRRSTEPDIKKETVIYKGGGPE